MYVTELDRPWRDTPFLFQGFEIRSPADIDEIRRHCEWVYIEVPDAPPVPTRASPVRPRRQRYFPTEAEQRAARDLLKVVNQPRAEPVYTDRSTLEQEMPAAHPLYVAARTLLNRIRDDVCAGKPLDGLGVRRAVSELAESVIRNPDALTCLTQLKRKDEYTALHSLRVCILALAFGRHLGLDRELLQMLGIGALLHDLGKLKVPNEILNKPGALNDRELELMKNHVPYGVEILERTPGIPRPAIEVARCHHERYDGTGYLEGLKHEQIGFFGMIGGIVDCYDAITSDRAYRAGISGHAALKRMYEWRTRDFHPGLTEQFIQCMGIYPIGSVVELSTGEVGVVVTMNRVRRLKPQVALVLDANATPYRTRVTVDLMHHKGADGESCDIERVLAPEVYGIDPVRYLPLPDMSPAVAATASATGPA